MEKQDIFAWQKTGHFYVGLTPLRYFFDIRGDNMLEKILPSLYKCGIGNLINKGSLMQILIFRIEEKH